MSQAADDTRRDAEVVPFPLRGPDGSRSENTPPPPLRVVIGEVLRDERTEQGRTLGDVASDAHVSLPYLSEVERGVKDVSSEVLAAICDALQLPLVEVLERSADRLRAGAQSRHRLLLLAA